MIQYCNHCAHPVTLSVPPGDNRLRHCCPTCGHIQYQNPRLVVGCIAHWQDKILLCRRAIEPRMGYWTLPAGFMENNESTSAAALRETEEEAGASVCIEAPFALISLPEFDQVHLFYRGHLKSPDYEAGEESLEVALLAETEIPWSTLAFNSVRFCLERYLSDRKAGHFNFHETTWLKAPPLLGDPPQF